MNGKKITSNIITQMVKQSIEANRMRNMFVMITIVLSSALLTAVLMFAAGQKQQEKEALSHRQQVTYLQLTETQAERLKKDDRIAYQMQTKKGIISQMDGFDVVPCYASELSEEISIAQLESGTLPVSVHEVAVYGAMLEKMKIKAPIKASIGSDITLRFYDGSTETFTISGILKGGSAAKQFSVFFSREYAKTGSQLKKEPYAVYAKISGAEQMDAQQCKEVMYQIGRDAGVEREYVNPSQTFIDSLSVDMQSVMLYGLIGIVILTACVLVIYGVFYLSVVGRIHQFGQLRTIGMTKKQIKKFVSREGGVLFCCASPFGILIGAAAAGLMIPEGFQVFYAFLIAVFVFIVVYAVTLMSVQKPARLAAAVSPMEALRYMPQENMKKAASKKLCRRLTPFSLGAMNFSKNRKKAMITMLSLGMSGILYMTAAVYIASFDKELYVRQDYFKDAEFNIQYSQGAIELNENGLSGLQAQVVLGDSFVQEIAALDGVKKVNEIKAFGVRFDDPAHDLYGVGDVVYPMTEEETRKIGRYLEEGSADYDKLMSQDYILVADNDLVQEIYGWSFRVGDSITLHYYDGSKTAEKKVAILGVLSSQFAKDYSGRFDGWFLMPQQALQRLVSYESLNTRLCVSTEAEKEAEVGEALMQMVDQKPELTMETLAERKKENEQSVNQQFSMIVGFSIFIMLFSMLSMINTLITNMVTKKQELAMLASIGMSRGQIIRMLLGESLLFVCAAVGATMTIGTACGYALCKTLYHNGIYYMLFQFPTALAAAYTGVFTVVPFVITFACLKNFSKEALVERLRGTENG